MKKLDYKFTILAGLLIILMLFSWNFPKINYLSNTASFKKISTEEVLLKINNHERFCLYVGRGTCPHCRTFVPKLNRVKEKLGEDIYYLDSENTESNTTLKAFRDNYQLDKVPSLIVFDSQSFSKFQGNSQSSEEVITDFFNENRGE